MKRFAIVLFVLALPAAAVAQATVEDIILLRGAGCGDDLILTYIGQRGGIGPLSANDIARLKATGVSDNLIGALIRANTPPPVIVEPPPRVVYVEPPPQVVVVEEYHYPYNPWWFVYSQRPGCGRPGFGFGVEYVDFH